MNTEISQDSTNSEQSHSSSEGNSAEDLASEVPKFFTTRFDADETAEASPATKTNHGAETETDMGPGKARFSVNPWSAVAWFLFLIIVAAIIFYVGNGQPLVRIDRPTTISSPVPTPVASPVAPSEPAYTILGYYDGDIFTYNSGDDKIFAYRPQTSEERQVATVPRFEKFLWHNSGKVLLVSNLEHPFGNIYLFDLTKQSPKPELPTERETTPNFPPNLRVDTTSELAWSKSGEAIAFTAHNTENGKESLFIYQMGRPQLIYTPARNMDSISSLLWITNTMTTTTGTLSFVAISDGQEDRYFVDRSGGGFAKWMVK